MSSNNDEDGDGLAALFGGITPQGAPPAEPSPRRAAAEPVAQGPSVPPAPVTPPQPATPVAAPVSAAAAPQYPGLAPEPYAAPAFSPASPTPPASSGPPASPAYEMPAPAAAPQPTPPPGPAYDMPAPAVPPAGSPYGAPVTPQYPGLAPTAPPVYPATPSPAATPPPETTSYPGASPYGGSAPSPAAYPPTAQYPAGVDSAVSAPYGGPTPAAPAAPPPAAQQPTYQPPTYQPPTYQPSAYEPPAQGPAAHEPPGYAAPVPVNPVPETPAYQPPALETPPAYASPTSYQPPPSSYGLPADTAGSPRSEPEPIVEPPAFNGFETLGIHPPGADVPAGAPGGFGAGGSGAGGFGGGEPPAHQASAHEPPAQASSPEHPLVRAEPAPLAAAFPPGPLLPDPTAVVVTPEELGRPTVVEKVGVGVAALTGPIGLVFAIVTAARGLRRRGWLIGIARASLVLGVISTIVAGIGGYALWNLRMDQLQHDQVAASSAEFCAAGAADPAIVTAPRLGWPDAGSTITESLALMQAWTDNWRSLAATSPEELRAGMDLLVTRGQTIIDAVSASRTVDEATNEQQITSIEGQSGVAGWYATYCAAP